MLNFFTCPKPSNPAIDAVQQRAIQSWKSLNIHTNITIFPEDQLLKTEAGAPRVDDMFRLIRRSIDYGIYVYSNADICFDDTLIRAIAYASRIGKEFMIVGETISEQGQSRGKAAIDWCVFTKEAVDRDMPPFALGRIAWDNWLVIQAVSRGIPVIDATQVVKAVHIAHDYSHIQGGYRETRTGQDAKRNLEMAGGEFAHSGRTDRAPYSLDENGNIWSRYNQKVSIITPTIQGREKFLERCKQSVANQNYSPELIEHIIEVDTDGGQRSATRNRAIEKATGTYICYLDDDDWYYPNHVSTLVNFLEFTSANCCYSLAHKVPEDSDMRVNGEIICEWNQEPFDDPVRGNWTPVNTICHRKSCGVRWDERLEVLEDWRFNIEMQRRYGMHKIPRITAAYSVRETGTIANPEYNERKWAAAEMIKKECS